MARRLISLEFRNQFKSDLIDQIKKINPDGLPNSEALRSQRNELVALFDDKNNAWDADACIRATDLYNRLRPYLPNQESAGVGALYPEIQQFEKPTPLQPQPASQGQISNTVQRGYLLARGQVRGQINLLILATQSAVQRYKRPAAIGLGSTVGLAATWLGRDLLAELPLMYFYPLLLAAGFLSTYKTAMNAVSDYFSFQNFISFREGLTLLLTVASGVAWGAGFAAWNDFGEMLGQPLLSSLVVGVYGFLALIGVAAMLYAQQGQLYNYAKDASMSALTVLDTSWRMGKTIAVIPRHYLSRLPGRWLRSPITWGLAALSLPYFVPWPSSVQPMSDWVISLPVKLLGGDLAFTDLGLFDVSALMLGLSVMAWHEWRAVVGAFKAGQEDCLDVSTLGFVALRSNLLSSFLKTGFNLGVAGAVVMYGATLLSEIWHAGQLLPRPVSATALVLPVMLGYAAALYQCSWPALKTLVRTGGLVVFRSYNALVKGYIFSLKNDVSGKRLAVGGVVAALPLVAQKMRWLAQQEFVSVGQVKPYVQVMVPYVAYSMAVAVIVSGMCWVKKALAQQKINWFALGLRVCLAVALILPMAYQMGLCAAALTTISVGLLAADFVLKSEPTAYAGLKKKLNLSPRELLMLVVGLAYGVVPLSVGMLSGGFSFVVLLLGVIAGLLTFSQQVAPYLDLLKPGIGQNVSLLKSNLPHPTRIAWAVFSGCLPFSIVGKMALGMLAPKVPAFLVTLLRMSAMPPLVILAGQLNKMIEKWSPPAKSTKTSPVEMGINMMSTLGANKVAVPVMSCWLCGVGGAALNDSVWQVLQSVSLSLCGLPIFGRLPWVSERISLGNSTAYCVGAYGSVQQKAAWVSEQTVTLFKTTFGLKQSYGEAYVVEALSGDALSQVSEKAAALAQAGVNATTKDLSAMAKGLVPEVLKELNIPGLANRAY